MGCDTWIAGTGCEGELEAEEGDDDCDGDCDGDCDNEGKGEVVNADCGDEASNDAASASVMSKENSASAVSGITEKNSDFSGSHPAASEITSDTSPKLVADHVAVAAVGRESV